VRKILKDIDLFEFHQLRNEGKVLREEYWLSFRTFLIDFHNFVKLQDLLGNHVLVDETKVIIDIKSTKSHKSRISMYLDPIDVRSVPFSVLADGPYEPLQSDIVVELGKVSELFLDIGANMGFYSLALAMENPNLYVKSFEPQPEVFRMLEENIVLNKLQNRISARNIGLGKKVDLLTMYIPKFTGSGGGSFNNHHADEGNSVQLQIPVLSLNEIEFDKVDLMKVDVEGFEFDVIIGASQIIYRDKPTIVIELLRKWMKPFGHFPQEVLNYLFDIDYKCFAIGTNTLSEIFEVNDYTLETNFIFVHSTNLNHLPIILGHVEK
jgi:FkbM family methyltransferase